MISLHAPFDAYKGKEPYIFVSYAHRNSSIVFHHITRLKNEGFRIWYDEGIDPGTDWSDEIANALEKAASFLVFVSPEMVASHNVKKEIVFAISRRKHMVAVHIAETTLPAGLEMQLSNIQALLENRFNDKQKFYDRLIAAFPPETKGSRQLVVELAKEETKKGLFGWFKRKQKIEQPSILLESNEVVETKTVEISIEKSSVPPLEMENQKPAERQIAQPIEYQNNVEEEGVISFFPFGTLVIKTISGEEYTAILNTVSGFPVPLKKDGSNYELALDTFFRAEFIYQNKEEYKKSLTIHIYDENNKETILVEDYEIPSNSNLGTISFLTDTGMRFLSLNQVERMMKDENETPQMPEYIRYVYIRSGGMVYKAPQPLLKFEWGSTYRNGYGISRCGDDIFRTNSLKYIRICKEKDGFGRTDNAIYANVYFIDNSFISTTLNKSYLVMPTSLGEIRSIISDVDEIFFGIYDVDFAKKVVADIWDGSKIVPFTLKGIATVYKNDGTKFVFALNSLVAVGMIGRTYNSYPTTYIKADHEMFRPEVGTDTPPLFFQDAQSMNIKKINDILFADYLLYSNETGKKRIGDYTLEGLTENGNGSIYWNDVEKIDFDNNRNVVLSQLKKAIIADKNGCVFETLQATLYFSYPHQSGGMPYWNNEQKVKIEGGLAITYDKIKKIEFLPEKREGDKTRYPAKITLRAGGVQELMLDIAGYFNSNLQFLIPIGVSRYNLKKDVQSIEFIH